LPANKEGEGRNVTNIAGRRNDRRMEHSRKIYLEYRSIKQNENSQLATSSAGS